MKPGDFDLVKVQWEGYRDSTLTPNDYTDERIAGELWQCCPNDLQTILLSHNLTPTSPVMDLLTKIKMIWVTPNNARANRIEFGKSKQMPGEVYRLYTSRLKDLSRYCDFKATGGASYRDQSIMDMANSGIYCPTTKAEVMELDAREKLDLAQLELVVESKEFSKRTMALDGVKQLARISDFQQDKQTIGSGPARGRDGRGGARNANSGGAPQNCKYCGRTRHGRSPKPEERKQGCPAWEKECDKCKKRGHLSSVCRGSGNHAATVMPMLDSPGGFFLISSGPRTHNQRRPKILEVRQNLKPLEHMERTKGKWRPARGEPPPSGRWRSRCTP